MDLIDTKREINQKFNKIFFKVNQLNSICFLYTKLHLSMKFLIKEMNSIPYLYLKMG